MATEVRQPEQDDLLRNVDESQLKPVHTWPHLVSIELIGALIFTLLLSIIEQAFKRLKS